MGNEVAQILYEIADEEFSNNRPLLSAIAVGVSGKPGAGFYALGRETKKFFGSGKEEEEKFWKKECQAVYETWKVDLRA